MLTHESPSEVTLISPAFANFSGAARRRLSRVVR
ncbi:hypothetical protein MESS2_1460019 [Mesorhizobium metallidurans STM 2683]|uniref:Uncharacterized protein n=1 Tax=Mesorhizobium metallidurans STM 2683 TaxID=1297569 RepID=M5EJN8_9HYPH|nr:hypothetical protein MESS2_1460019 [Mesorhizobium metallidurans STM 2683]